MDARGLISAAVCLSTWIARTIPRDVEADCGLMVIVVQLAVALGLTACGLLFNKSGYQIALVPVRYCF